MILDAEIFPELVRQEKPFELLQPVALPTSLHIRDRVPPEDMAEYRWEWKPVPQWPLLLTI